MTDTRIPPHDVELEQNVLGILLVNSGLLCRVYDSINVEYFYTGQHRQIWDSIVQLHRKSQPIDIVTVSGWLKDRDQLDMQFRQYITDISLAVATTANLEYLVAKLRWLFNRRELISIANHAIASAYDLSKEDVVEDAAKQITRIAQTAASDMTPLVGDLVDGVMARIEDRILTGVLPGHSTGFKNIDDAILGLKPGDLYILAGRPAMGKSALGFQIAQNVAQLGGRALVFSLEMSAEQIIKRQLSVTSDTTHDALETGKMLDADVERLRDSVEKLRPIPMHIREAANYTAADIASHARRVKFEHKDLALIVVDYLQLVTTKNPRKSDNRNIEVGAVSGALKALALELKVPVLALSQLSRDVENSDSKRPQLRHLRDSGSLEQDSDVVLFVHRPEYFDKNSDRRGEADLIVAKNRHGGLSDIPLLFHAPTTRFSDHYAPNLVQNNFAPSTQNHRYSRI